MAAKELIRQASTFVDSEWECSAQTDHATFGRSQEGYWVVMNGNSEYSENARHLKLLKKMMERTSKVELVDANGVIKKTIFKKTEKQLKRKRYENEWDKGCKEWKNGRRRMDEAEKRMNKLDNESSDEDSEDDSENDSNSEEDGSKHSEEDESDSDESAESSSSDDSANSSSSEDSGSENDDIE